ncbi:MAG TPA: IPT/TIG domain-containing protein [Galbitalea sp.]|jgi:hypothetical protein
MSTTLARKFKVDVTADLTLATGWLALNGINDFDPEIAPNLEDTTAYDTTGWGTSEPTLQEWTATATFFRRLVAGVYDPGQELVRNTVGQFGNAARVGIRWYDRNGGPEAYSGVAIPAWKRANTGVKNVEQATATFTGTDIPLNLGISNPYTTASVPVITGITPAGVAVGGSVAIQGQYFTGLVATTGVKFNAVNATSFAVINDGLAIAVLPAGSAGATPVILTNATGASTAFSYTRA